jgi:MFS family permease
MSPNEAGLVMTPLLVCITLGSIINGRLLPRMRRAERLLAYGQAGLAVSCLLLLPLNAASPHWLMMGVFTLCGISLGFQLPNITLQIMAVAGRTHMGVAAALAQSTRMVGSMVGVGIASALVNSLYAREVAAVLQRLQVTSAPLIELVSSPQVLIRHQDREAMTALAQGLSLDPGLLLEAAREGLVRGTHSAFWVCALLSAISVVISLRLPHYNLHQDVSLAGTSGKQTPQD